MHHKIPSTFINFTAQTIEVTSNEEVLDFIPQEYSVDMYLGQFWQDPRLAFGLNKTIILGGEASEKLWVPDTFFVNSIESKIQTMMFTNKKVWISLKNGTMMLSAR
jgi:hypothetical protein